MRAVSKGATEPQLAYLGVEQMCVHHGSFDIVQVGVVFQSSLKQTRLLTQLSNVGTVVVGEHLVPQNRICHLKKREHTNVSVQIVFYHKRARLRSECEPGGRG